MGALPTPSAPSLIASRTTSCTCRSSSAVGARSATRFVCAPSALIAVRTSALRLVQAIHELRRGGKGERGTRCDPPPVRYASPRALRPTPSAMTGDENSVLRSFMRILNALTTRSPNRIGRLHFSESLVDCRPFPRRCDVLGNVDVRRELRANQVLVGVAAPHLDARVSAVDPAGDHLVARSD